VSRVTSDSALAGRVALVTGAGSGIGAACARAAAYAGARVYLADVDLDGAEAVAQEIRADGGDVEAVELDVTDPAAVTDCVDSAVEEAGGLHLAVNSAGITHPFAPLWRLDDDTWREVLAVDLDGVFHCLRAEIAAMRRTDARGSVVNIASIMGLAAGRGVGAYVAAKHGVVGLTRAAALEVAEQGIRVNAVAPGFVDTPLLAAGLDELRDTLIETTPMGRLASADEIAELVVWLLSDRATFVTGTCMVADGGFTAQ
jgi:NAD(P)-dependent dehydrogenase (short-subunit alcohol dehydrogenase family)